MLALYCSFGSCIARKLTAFFHFSSWLEPSSGTTFPERKKVIKQTCLKEISANFFSTAAIHWYKMLLTVIQCRRQVNNFYFDTRSSGFYWHTPKTFTSDFRAAFVHNEQHSNVASGFPKTPENMLRKWRVRWLQGRRFKILDIPGYRNEIL